ncbi:MAG: UvrD-helicase domain-containing protein [Bacteroidetes bacterium]|nr:UvrD-helicase domain-containing protein [Bacteroidota bacterium]
MSNYLNELNESQRDAVLCTEGPVMIVAGAGSGKTRVLTYRIAHLMSKEVDAFNILALTFTNKAARSMKEKITNLVGDNEARNLWMGTFHSVFARILRFEHDKLNYPANFTIYDTADSKNLVKDIVKQMQLDEKVYKPSMLLARISQMKTMLLSFEAYQHNSSYTESDRSSGRLHFGEIFETYCKRCFKAGAMDFDDILYNTSILLRDHPEILYKYQNKFKYILVDEYQDTNFAQYMIIKQLAARFENICVVGDDAQSIYAFRGANIENILNFKSDYPDTRTFKLEQNYRSTKNIVNAANSLILKNKNQIQKQVWTDNSEGEKIKVVRALTDNEEGAKVAQMIFESMMQHQMHPKEFAILYRTNAQSRAMEEALRKRNIAYRIYGGLSFYQRKEIKDMLAYFRLTINNHDEEAMKRVINYPTRGIGNTTIDKIVVAANDHNISMFTVMENLNDFNVEMNAGARSKISDFVTMLKSFSAMLQKNNAYDLGNHIASKTGIQKDLYNDKSPEGVSRYENIEELLGALKEFSAPPGLPEGEEEYKPIDLPDLTPDPDLRSQPTVVIGEGNEGLDAPSPLERDGVRRLDVFMSDIALLTDSDKKDEPENRDHVSLMTIHQAKGLEFPHVFIVGLEENLFPNSFSMNSRDDLEEERRLFYVALTRAEKRSTLTFAATRFHRGSLINTEPSRFIEEIDPQYLELGGKMSQPREDGRGENIVDPTYDDLPVIRYGDKTRFKSQLPFGQNSKVSSHKPVARNQKPETGRQSQLTPKKLINATVAQYKPPSESQEHLRSLQVGMTVSHERFGNGKVLNMEGQFPNSKATVDFGEAGQKQLLLKFAKLEIVG